MGHLKLVQQDSSKLNPIDVKDIILDHFDEVGLVLHHKTSSVDLIIDVNEVGERRTITIMLVDGNAYQSLGKACHIEQRDDKPHEFEARFLDAIYVAIRDNYTFIVVHRFN